MAKRKIKSLEKRLNSYRNYWWSLEYNPEDYQTLTLRGRKARYIYNLLKKYAKKMGFRNPEDWRYKFNSHKFYSLELMSYDGYDTVINYHFKRED